MTIREKLDAVKGKLPWVFGKNAEAQVPELTAQSESKTLQISLLTLAGAVNPIIEYFNYRTDEKDHIENSWIKLGNTVTNCLREYSNSESTVQFRNHCLEIARNINKTPDGELYVTVNKSALKTLADTCDCLADISAGIGNEKINLSTVSPNVHFWFAEPTVQDFPELDPNEGFGIVIKQTYVSFMKYLASEPAQNLLAHNHSNNDTSAAQPHASV